MSPIWKWSTSVVVLGVLVRWALSQVNETLGAWVGISLIVFGALVFPLINWLRSRRSNDQVGETGASPDGAQRL